MVQPSPGERGALCTRIPRRSYSPLLGFVTAGHSCLTQDCGLELNDEDGHRCYPLEDHLFCHACHVRRLDRGPSAPALHQHF